MSFSDFATAVRSNDADFIMRLIEEVLPEGAHLEKVKNIGLDFKVSWAGGPTRWEVLDSISNSIGKSNDWADEVDGATRYGWWKASIILDRRNPLNLLAYATMMLSLSEGCIPCRGGGPFRRYSEEHAGDILFREILEMNEEKAIADPGPVAQLRRIIGPAKFEQVVEYLTGFMPVDGHLNAEKASEIMCQQGHFDGMLAAVSAIYD